MLLRTSSERTALLKAGYSIKEVERLYLNLNDIEVVSTDSKERSSITKLMHE